MGWTILFLAIVFIVLANSVKVRSQTRDRRASAIRRADRARHMQATQTTVPSGAPIRPGDSPVYAPGDSATYAPGDSATYRPGDPATYRAGNSPFYSPGDSSTYPPGDSRTFGPGNSPTYAPGDSATYAPARPVGYRPMPAPPAIDPAPAIPPSGGQRRPQQQMQPVQPAYATRIERATVRRDQAVLDRDRRRAARTDPTQAPQEGSTAITSRSLNTTLAMPYQPSSLASSLSTSLSSTLFDTPPVVPPSMASILGAVSTVTLPRALEEQVVLLIRDGNEVDAVRIVIDQLNVGILEATKTIRSYGDQGTA